MQGTDKNRFRRREAVGMNELVEEFIREMKLASGLNRQRVIAAWNAVSGAQRYTVDVFIKDKVLYCTMGSSMARNQLYFQKDVILAQINEYLEADELYVKEGEAPYIKELVLK
jgi:hypothetical protein